MKRNNKEGFKLISLRTDKWKFIYDEEKEKEYLFDIIKDSNEIKNLIDHEPEITEDFRLKLASHLKRVDLISEKSKLSSIIQKLDFSKLKGE